MIFVLFPNSGVAKMSDDEKRDDRKRKAESQDEEKEKEEEESDSDDGEMIGPMPTEAAPIKKPKVLARNWSIQWCGKARNLALH